MLRFGAVEGRQTVLALVCCVAASGAAGCEDEPSTGACRGEGEPRIELAQRNGETPIVDGADLPIFPPPQGGVWTEIDVRLLGVTVEEIESIRVDVLDAGSAILASELYLGENLPLLCRVDGSIEIDNMPVGFGDLSLLEALDGVGATMIITLAHGGGDTVATAGVTLRADSF